MRLYQGAIMRRSRPDAKDMRGVCSDWCNNSRYRPRAARTMEETMADESLRKSASEAMKAGEDVARRVRELTLDALRNRRFDREGIREVVRTVTEGMAAAAPASGGSLRNAMGQAFRGLDEALTKSVEAGESALRQLIATGRGISDKEVEQ